MHIFCTKCGKHIDVSLEELENQSGHLVCPQCLAEIDVDVDLFNGNAPAMPGGDFDDLIVTPCDQGQQKPPANSKSPTMPTEAATGETPPTESSTAASQLTHIDDVMRYCKQCGTFLKEGVNFCPKCGKYVRVIAPPHFNQPLTPAQQEAAKLRASTTPVKRIPANKQSNYKPPQDPTLQDTPMGHQQRNPLKSVRNSGKRRNTSSKNKGSWFSKFDILSIGGCLTITVVAVVLFFIIYILFAAIFNW